MISFINLLRKKLKKICPIKLINEPNSPINMDTKLWNSLDNFVKIVCANRDESHGHAHMKKVAESSTKIYASTQIYHSRIYCLVVASAWLHDVVDHKYVMNVDIWDKINNLLEDFFVEADIILIKNIIERISFSKENQILKNGEKLDWLEVLGEDGLVVRDIVSDADKLEAIGKIGIDRCVEYTKEMHLKKFGEEVNRIDLVAHVHIHAMDKLLKLTDSFIRTPYAKLLAKPLHHEMIKELDDMLWLDLTNLYEIAGGLNIEGPDPYFDLIKQNPNGIWVNAILVLDRPIVDNILFDAVLEVVKINNYPLLENAIDNINEHKMLSIFLLITIFYIETYPNKKITIHFHQDILVNKLIEIFDQMLHSLMQK